MEASWHLKLARGWYLEIGRLRKKRKGILRRYSTEVTIASNTLLMVS